MSGVSCTSPSSCIAVGDTGVPGPAFAERWNGKVWTVESTPSTGAFLMTLSGVACPSAVSCEAVGFEEDPNSAIAEHWDGRAWSMQNTPQAVTVALLDVACPSINHCVAAGFSAGDSGQGVTLAEAWNGTSWIVMATPGLPSNPTVYPDSELGGLSCPSVAACVAIGWDVTKAGVVQTLVERWNGMAWTITPAPAVGPLGDVACASPLACTAVGSSVDAAGNPVTAAWRATGTGWAHQTTTSPVGEVAGSFSGISCVSAALCSAVGKAGGSVLAERWNGTQRSVDRAPNPAPGAALDAVSCPSATTCMAVGSYPTNSTGVARSFSELRSATGGWSQYAVPSPAAGSSMTLAAVSCASSTSCMAVGYLATNAIDRGGSLLAESWNGHRWTIETPAAAPKDASAAFAGVSCPAPEFCEAVGDYSDASSGNLIPLAERWNGAEWTVERAVAPAYMSSEFNGVTCLSATSCVAVGDQYDGAETDSSLVEARVGTSWSVQPSADNGNDFVNILVSVACKSIADCTAVGYSTQNAYSTTPPLAEGWNGTAWQIQATPKSTWIDSQLSGVTCPDGTCLAVGSGAGGPLVLRR
jgi:hypothetical protein